MDEIKLLRNLCHPGIFCLYNRKKNKAFVTVSVNMGFKVSEILKKLETDNFNCLELVADKDDLELIVLETYKHVHQKVGYNCLIKELAYWQDYIQKQGIELYDHKFPTVTYKARLNFAVDDKGKDLILVEAITKRYNRTIVGVFNTIPEAKDFMAKHYNKRVNKLVTAFNKQTKAFLATQG